MPTTMKAVDIKDGKGPASSMHIASIPMPEPKPSEALVHIKAFGLNRMDILQRLGQYPVPPGVSKILGVEFSGVVHQAAKEGKEDFKEGDEVFGLAYGGAYAEYIAVSARMLVHKPTAMSWEAAAGIPETWITATQALHVIAEHAPGQSVLWHAGASSVSISGIQLARANGAGAIYTTSSAGKIPFLTETKSLSVTKAFDRAQDWPQQVLDATGGKGVDIIVDFVGAPYFTGNVKAAAKDARIVLLGFMGGAVLPEGVNIAPLLLKRLRYEGSSLRSRDEEYQGKLRTSLVDHAMPKFTSGEFELFIEKVFPWTSIVEAHELMESNKTRGKIICTIDW